MADATSAVPSPTQAQGTRGNDRLGTLSPKPHPRSTVSCGWLLSTQVSLFHHTLVKQLVALPVVLWPLGRAVSWVVQDLNLTGTWAGATLTCGVLNYKPNTVVSDNVKRMPSPIRKTEIAKSQSLLLDPDYCFRVLHQAASLSRRKERESGETDWVGGLKPGHNDIWGWTKLCVKGLLCALEYL